MLFGTVKHRRSHRHTAFEVLRQRDDFVIGQGVDVLDAGTRRVIHLAQEVANFSNLLAASITQHGIDLDPETTCRHTQVGFQDLTNVHTRRYTQRVQHHVHRLALLVERHVFDGHDRGDNTFVTVTTGHLVTGLDTTLHRHVDLDDFQHARREIVALGQFALLVFETLVHLFTTVFELFVGLGQQLVVRLVLHAQLEPLLTGQFVQVRFVQHVAFLQLRSTVDGLTGQRTLQTLEGGIFGDAVGLLKILTHFVQLHLLDGECTGVFFDAVTGEDLNVDDRPFHAGGGTQRGIFYVGRFLTEDGAEQLLFGRQLGFAFGRNLTDQNVTRADFGTDVDDACFIQFTQRGLTDVGNIGGDLFRPQLGVAGHTGQFLDVDRGETVFLNHTLGEQNGVLEVVAVPGHERDTHVLTQRQIPHVDGRTVGEDIATCHVVARTHDGTLVHAGVLVRTGVLGQVVDVDTGFTADDFIFVDPHHDTTRVDGVNDAATARHGTHAGVACHETLHAGTDQRLVGAQGRHGLTLHVRTHQGAVSIVVLEERNQRGGHGDDLTRRHVHQRHLLGTHEGRLATVTHLHQVIAQLARLIHGGRGLRDNEIALLDRGEMHHLIGHLAVDDFTIRRFQEAVAVGVAVRRQRVDQADVRAFRRFDRA